MNYTISPDRRLLAITVTEAERATLRAMPESAKESAETGSSGRDVIHADATMVEFLSPMLANSELEWVWPHETGDLTDAPMLGILGEEGVRDHTVFLPNHGLRATGSDGHNALAVPILERWAWLDYQTVSLLEALRDTGRAVLVSG